MNLNKWLFCDIFRGLKLGILLEIFKNKQLSEIINYKLLKGRKWKHYINRIINNNNKLTKYKYPKNSIVSLLPLLNLNHFEVLLDSIFYQCNQRENKVRFTHILISHTKNINDILIKLDHSKYRFGALIIKKENAQILEKQRILTELLENNGYSLFRTKDNYICFYSTIGVAPYYLGQPILDNYYITGNLISGCGSSAVYTIKDRKGDELVLKKSSNLNNYAKELKALKITENWEHSPSLIDYNKKNKFIITNWCGKDLKRVDDNYKLELKNKIQELSDILNKQFNLYHNDIRWKNITIISNKIIFIDWGMSEVENKEKDHDYILREDQRQILPINDIKTKSTREL